MNNAITIQVDGHKSINSLVFLEDSKHLLSGGEDGTIRQWRIEDGNEVEDQRLIAGQAVRAIAISRDGNWIVGTGNKMAAVWNRRTRQIAYAKSGLSGWVNSVDVSADSTKYAAGTSDQGTIIQAISNGRELVVLGEPTRGVLGVKFSPDGDRILVAVRDKVHRWLLEESLCIYDAYGGQPLQRFNVENLHPGNPFAWSDDARHIFALSNCTIQHLRDNETIPLSEWIIPGYPSHGTQLAGIALPSNGRFIAAFTGRTLTLWNSSTHVRFGPVLEHLQVNHLCSIALSPDSNHVATGSNDGTITLHNLSSVVSSINVDRMVAPAEARDIMPSAVGSESHSEKSSGAITQPSDRVQVTVQRVPDGTYHVKSVVGDLYLTCPQAGTGTVAVQPLNRSNASQRWTVSLVGDGAYEVTSNSELSLTVGMGAPLLVGPKDTTWTFDARGDAYVIGNAANIMAVQLELYPPSVSVLPRNSSPCQRWALEICEEITASGAGTSERDVTSSSGRQRGRHSRGRRRGFTPRQS